tara:strand:- start:667 stop:1728 length:1062 start_codon:yes stop_codon:yes gene_type:complete
MAYISFQPSDYFNTLLYTGDGSGSNRSLTGVGFQPDWVWNKSRSNAYNHYLFDAPRGAGKRIGSNSTAAEDDKSAEFISFDSDGFTVNNNGSSLAINASGVTFANWCWKGGTTSGISGGDITPSSYSFSTVSGFSVVKYQGNGSTGATVAHGLGAAPKMVMVKGLGDTYGWKVWHTDLASGKTLNLHNGNAEATDSNYISASSSTTFTTTGTYSVNENGNNYVAYCFAEKKGFSKIGSYTGNSNANGTFIYCGFKPAFVLIKNISTSNHWLILDTKRSVFNLTDDALFANETSAEQVDQSSASGIDILSNGFKIKTTGNAAANYNNNSGDSYIFMAFAEEPLVSSNGVPATAR